MRKLNETACDELYEAVVWSEPGIIVTLTVLGIVNIMVVLGNLLVILAVYRSVKLRNVTNTFIVSLAVADLMVGIAVLPFSATWEVFKVWIFGDIWCSIWLAVDVWMCTASILNLCAISLDRYLAVTRPVNYPQIMSPSRARFLVAFVWILSFIICFPPLVGWKDQTRDTDNSTITDSELFNSTSANDTIRACRWICELTNDTGYVVYSALGSFYIPMLVMMFFYWRIYNAAVSTTKAINQGFRTTKSSKFGGNRFEDQRLTLRIHRGKTTVYNGKSGNPGTSKNPQASPSRREGIKISVSYPSTETLNTKYSDTFENTSSKASHISVHYLNGQTQNQICSSSKSGLLKVGDVSRSGSTKRSNRRSSAESQTTADATSLSDIPGRSSEEKAGVMKMGKRNIKAQVKRIRMETKAAKTLGIIVGVFILCWFPFFTMYLIRAFCTSCIHPTVFSVLFWLGYCNSAINPCIYALFSKDFRFAFKKIICEFFCKHRANAIRRESDGSQLTSRFRFAETNRSHTIRSAVRRRAFRSKTQTSFKENPTPSSSRRATSDDCSTSGSARSMSP